MKSLCFLERAECKGGGKGILCSDEMTFTPSTDDTMRICMHEDENNPVIRRLTPLECERLQGFPDRWTDIRWNGKNHSPDGRRYKAIGNSMAVPVMLWIGERLQNIQSVVRDDAAIERLLFGTNEENQLSLF